MSSYDRDSNPKPGSQQGSVVSDPLAVYAANAWPGTGSTVSVSHGSSETYSAASSSSRSIYDTATPMLKNALRSQRDKKPDHDYSFLRYRPELKASGEWSTKDPKTGKQLYDRKYHTEKRKANEASDTDSLFSDSTVFKRPNTDVKFTPGLIRDKANLGDDTEVHSGWGTGESNFVAMPGDYSDERYENMNLDVDMDIRQSFVHVKDIMKPRVAPATEFEQRNPFLKPKPPARAIRNVIGGKVVSTIKPKIDTRGEHMDRHGKYIGENLGLMKKHHMEDRAAAVKRRDQEMVKAMREKKKWEAMSDEEKISTLSGKRGVLGLSMGIGCDSSDLGSSHDIPDMYQKPVDTGSIAEYRRSSARSRKSNTPVVGSKFGSHSNISAASTIRVGTPLSGLSHPLSPTSNGSFQNIDIITDSEAESLHVSSSSKRSTNDSTGKKSALSSHPTGSSGVVESLQSSSTIKRVGDKTASNTASTIHSKGAPVSSTSESGSAFSISPRVKLAPLEDLEDPFEVASGEVIPGEDEEKYYFYEEIRFACLQRGRVVAVKLHDGVRFTAGSVFDRLFGGPIQEAQFFPAERVALVVFVIPKDAHTFVKHNQTVKEKSLQEHRRLQIDVEWYQGSEDKAIQPVQPKLLTKILAEQCYRVLQINHIFPKAPDYREIFNDQIERELAYYLEKTFAGIVTKQDNRRYMQRAEGKWSIVEFISIKDCIEAMRRFKKGLVEAFTDERLTFDYLADPKDKAASKMPWCFCDKCKHLD
jgi:hypothetical protein